MQLSHRRLPVALSFPKKVRPIWLVRRPSLSLLSVRDSTLLDALSIPNLQALCQSLQRGVSYSVGTRHLAL